MALSYSSTPDASDATVYTNALNILAIDTSEWIHSEAEDVNANGIREAVYHLKDSGMDHPVTFKVHLNLSGNNAYARFGIQGWVVTTDSVTGLDTYEPVSLFYGITYPGKTIDRPFDLGSWAKMLMGTIYADHATNKATCNAFRKLSDGDVRILESVYTDVVS